MRDFLTGSDAHLQATEIEIAQMRDLVVQRRSGCFPGNQLNEAFAAQVLAVIREWEWADLDRLNVNGSGISLGHPVAATGVRILASLAHEMKRRDARYGLETMCIGGGQGLAAIFER